MPLNADISYWPLLQVGLKKFCLPNPSNSKLKFIWSIIRSISHHDIMVEGYYLETSIEIFICDNFLVAPSPLPLQSVLFIALKQKADTAQNTEDLISAWIFRKHRSSSNLNAQAHYFERVRFLGEKSCHS